MRLPVIPIAVFVLVLVTVFGPKYLGIDFSILALLAAFVMARGWQRPLIKELGILFLLLCCYLCYVLSVQLWWSVPSTEIILRTIRALVAVALFATLGNVLLIRGDLLLPCLLLAILAHATLVIIGAHADPVNALLGATFGNDRVRHLRSSGLVAGFDVAGFFCVVGLFMVLFDVVQVRYAGLKWLMVGVFFYATSLTSRVSLILSIVVTFAFVVQVLRKKDRGSLVSRAVALTLGIGSLAYGGYEVGSILEVAFGFDLVPVSDQKRAAIVERFATSTVEDAGLPSMYFLPSGIASRLFGIGRDAIESDVGYIKFIHWHGLFGLILLLIAIGYLYRSTVRALRVAGAQSQLSLVKLIYFLMIILTLKNNYILTRGIWPVLLIVYLHSQWLMYSRASCTEDSSGTDVRSLIQRT